MRHALSIVLATGLLISGPAFAAEAIEAVPAEVIFVTSSGSWEDAPSDIADNATPRTGYYKLVALRQPDRTVRVYLQQIAVSDAGLDIVESVELDELSALKPYVTDIRPESSTGISSQPGLFATVFLKTDPAQREPESWTVLIDDLGDIRVERATN